MAELNVQRIPKNHIFLETKRSAVKEKKCFVCVGHIKLLTVASKVKCQHLTFDTKIIIINNFLF